MPQNNFSDQGLNNSGSGSNPEKLPKAQKTAVWFLSVLALMIFAGWLWQIQNHINSPFAYPANKAASELIIESDYLIVLQNRDTDSDGLSDYDEIYVHKTSPYLEDTDSDGLSDYEEIKAGTDPTCPQGKNCLVPETTGELTGGTVSGLNAVIVDPLLGTAGSGLYGTNEEILQNVLAGNIDAATLRALLLQSGAVAEDLDKISDEDLMRSYQETLESQELAE
ncbi:MAG: hypothetical protein WC545_03480 [Patescibacteria group bacterium]|jgi:hypothetical protein